MKTYKVTQGRSMMLTQHWQYLNLLISCERYRELLENHF